MIMVNLLHLRKQVLSQALEFFYFRFVQKLYKSLDFDQREEGLA